MLEAVSSSLGNHVQYLKFWHPGPWSLRKRPILALRQDGPSDYVLAFFP